MPRPIRATIDLDALRHNLSIARDHAGGARVWSVVKANAYGHGLLRAARALDELSDGLALLDLAEAIALREAGVSKPILLLEGWFQADDIPLFAEHELTAVIHSAEQIAMLSRAKLAARLPLFVKVNTGMNRLGFAPGELAAALAKLHVIPHAGALALMTHFADADGQRGIAEQLARFRRIGEGIDMPRSMANSAALLRFPEARGDWVRPGIMLYGSSPFPALRSAEELGLAPVMTLASELIAVQNLQPGDRVGYGGVFEAERAMRIGVVACGYADGYPRQAPNGTPILVTG